MKEYEIENENFPYETMFREFYDYIKLLDADYDLVDGIKREYVFTATMLPSYKITFGKMALSEGAIRYRQRQLKEKDYPNDFIKLEETVPIIQTKFIINRLNKELLKKVFLPHNTLDIKDIKNMNERYEDDFLSMEETGDGYTDDF